MSNDKWHSWYQGYENINLIGGIVWFGFLLYGAWFGINQFKYDFDLYHWGWNVLVLVFLVWIFMRNFLVSVNEGVTGFRDAIIYLTLLSLFVLAYQGFTNHLEWSPSIAILYFVPAIVILIWSHLAAKFSS